MNNTTRADALKDVIQLFTNGSIPSDILKGYLEDETGEGSMLMQSWIINNMRGEILGWCTGIGIIEAAEHLYETALETLRNAERKLKLASQQLFNFIEMDEEQISLTLNNQKLLS